MEEQIRRALCVEMAPPTHTSGDEEGDATARDYGILRGALADEYDMTKSVLHAPNTSPRACVGMAVSSDDF